MKVRRKKLLKYAAYGVLCVVLVAFAAAVIAFPDRYVNCCFQGFAMWAECVLPSLFPFMVITLIFIKTGIADKAALPLKRVTSKLKMPPAAGACFLLSVCSGYPAGSRVVCEFYDDGLITSRDANKLAHLCSTSGPLFILGSVGFKMFGNKLAGFKILICHVFSIVLVSLITSLFSKNSGGEETKRKKSGGNALYDSFYGAVIAVAVAGGFIAFFYLAANIAHDFRILYPLELFFDNFFDGQTSAAISLGFIEATTGCRALAQIGCTKINVAAAGFLITFGGLSILLQQLSYFLKAGVKPLKFIGIKLIQAAVCFVLLLLVA